ncbi:hypothetical protein ACVW04_004109 [Bradyrhizobium sp. LM2.3]
MKVKLLRERALAELRSKVSSNLDLYRSGEFEYLTLDSSAEFQ